MRFIYTSTVFAAALAAAPAAQAAFIKYDLDVDYNLTSEPFESVGRVDFAFDWELGVPVNSLAISSLSATFVGGYLDGLEITSDGSRVLVNERTLQSGETTARIAILPDTEIDFANIILDFRGPLSNGGLTAPLNFDELRFFSGTGSLYTEGFGYGQGNTPVFGPAFLAENGASFFLSDNANERRSDIDYALNSVSATSSVTAVPLPASGAMLALAVGGLGLRAAAKRRRAKRRASGK